MATGEGASLTVVGGLLDGTRLDIDDAVDEILVGSDPDCRLSLDLPGVSPIHARIWRDLGGVTVYDTRSPRGVYVNDERVVDQAALHDGDILWLGDPGDPDSVRLQCRLPEEGLLGAPVGEPEAPAAILDDLEALPPAAAAPEAAAPEADVLDGLIDLPEDVAPAPSDDLDVGGSTVMFRLPPPEPTAPPPQPRAAPPTIAIEMPKPAPPPTVAIPMPEPIRRPEPIAQPEPVAPLEPIEVFEPEAPFIPIDIPEPASPAAEPVAASAPDAAGDAWAKEAPPPLAPLPAVDLDLLGDDPIPAAPAVDEAAALEIETDAPAAETSGVDPTPIDLADAWETPPTVIGTSSEAADLVMPDEAPDTTFFTDDDAVAPAAAPPAVAAPPTAPVAAAPVSPVAAAPVSPVAPTPRRPVVAAPPPAATRAIIDDVPRKRATRAGASEDPMDWARSSSPSGPSEVPAATRTGTFARKAPARSRSLLIPIAAAALLAAAVGGYFFWNASRAPQVASVSPARARVGDTLTLAGENLGEAAGDATVTIGGRPAKVLRAAGTQLTVEVPEVATTAGRDTSAPVVVAVSGRESKPAAVALFQAPRLKALSPEVGMPGDEIEISGASLETGIRVTFGGAPAEVVQASGGSLRVKVPAITAAPGAEVPVEATLGADKSNAIPFVVGRVPLVTRLDVRNAAPGELVTVIGRGFDLQPDANRVTVGGVPALVVSATAREIKAVVPRVAMGESSLKVMVPGSANAGEAPFAVDPFDDPIGFRFVAEPFTDTPGHDHAALATGLGPAFILSGGGGKRAAERAYEAQRQLNDAAQVFASSREADVRARYEPTPALILYGRNIVLLDVTEADAAGYAEDWTRAGTRGGAVTPARLATWWEAVARDLVLLLARGEKPGNAVGLAAEGKALADLHDAARRTVTRGVPAAVAEGRPREGMRAIALRVPAAVKAPVPETADAAGTAAPAGSGTPAVDAIPPLRLDGAWSGIEFEGGQRKSISITFRGTGGTLTYQRALAMSVPVVGASQPQKGVVRFEVPTGGGRRYYRGYWDGRKVSGKLYLDAEGRREAGTFEIEKSE